jgi:hypothetical protein
VSYEIFHIQIIALVFGLLIQPDFNFAGRLLRQPDGVANAFPVVTPAAIPFAGEITVTLAVWNEYADNGFFGPGGSGAVR